MNVALAPVTGGPPVSLSTWRGVTESYGVTGHQGQAAMYVSIGHPGRYLLRAANVTPRSITGKGAAPARSEPVPSRAHRAATPAAANPSTRHHGRKPA
jgi:hypothetical protein